MRKGILCIYQREGIFAQQQEQETVAESDIPHMKVRLSKCMKKRGYTFETVTALSSTMLSVSLHMILPMRPYYDYIIFSRTEDRSTKHL